MKIKKQAREYRQRHKGKINKYQRELYQKNNKRRSKDDGYPLVTAVTKNKQFRTEAQLAAGNATRRAFYRKNATAIKRKQNERSMRKRIDNRRKKIAKAKETADLQKLMSAESSLLQALKNEAQILYI